MWLRVDGLGMAKAPPKSQATEALESLKPEKLGRSACSAPCVFGHGQNVECAETQAKRTCLLKNCYVAGAESV